MDNVFEIRTARQLRVLNPHATQAVFEAMQDAQPFRRKGDKGGMTASEAGEIVGISADSARYQIKKLVSIGLARVVSERKTGARPMKVFALTHSNLELRRGHRGPAFRRELVRGARLILRLAEREYEQACLGGEDWSTRPRAMREVAWLSTKDVTKLDQLEKKIQAVFREAESQARKEGRENRERVAVSVVLSPVERPDG